jgi:hypothetical protein
VLFATHPIHTDAVAPHTNPTNHRREPPHCNPQRPEAAWPCAQVASVVSRGEMLSAACFLLSLLAYARAAHADPARAASVLASLLWCSAFSGPQRALSARHAGRGREVAARRQVDAGVGFARVGGASLQRAGRHSRRGAGATPFPARAPERPPRAPGS